MNEQELWRSARTLRDLGALTARRLEGDIAYQPGYKAPCPDDETAGLIEDLAALNRAGFFTEQSQPGEIVGDWCQRAFVAGYADEALSFYLMAALCPTELVVVSSAPGTGTTGLADRRDPGGLPREHLGRHRRWGGIRSEYCEDLSEAALIALSSAWSLRIFDPVWGRNDRLWPALRLAIADGEEPDMSPRD